MGANDAAWTRVPLWAALGYGVVLAVALPRAEEPRTTALLLLLPCLIAVGLVVFVATQSRREWAWRSYALTVPATVVALAAGFAVLGEADSAARDRPVTATPRTVAEVTSLGTAPALERLADEAGPSRTRLTAPASVKGWARDNSEEVRAGAGAVAESAEQLYGRDAVAGLYRHPSSPTTGVLYVGVNGHIDQGGPMAVGRAALGAGGKVQIFPANGKGWLGCRGPGRGDAAAGVSCAWVAQRWAVFMRWDDPTVRVGRAAVLTRAFRTFASS